MTADAPALRAALVRCLTDHDAVGDLRQVAGLAGQAGLGPTARLFDRIALLHAGFAAPPVPPPATDAAADLTPLLDLCDGAWTGGGAPGADAPGGGAAERVDTPQLARLCEDLCARLSAGGDPAALLAAVQGGVVAHPPHALARLLGDPVDTLAGRVAFNIVRRLFVARYDLAFAPLGSAALFAAAARFSHGAIGPFLAGAEASGARRMVRRIRRAAAGRPGTDPDAALLWTVRLAPLFDRDQRVLLAETLGDEGALPALAALFRSETRRTALRLHPPVFWAIRDAALDLGDTALATDAQRHVAEGVADDPVEWIVLAETAAAAGRADEAAAAIDAALARDPGNRSAADKRAALRSGAIDAVAATGGFGSDRSRRLVRFMQRRAAAAAAAAPNGIDRPGPMG